MKQPYKQGILDGMCGFYSVLNAVHYLKDNFTATKAEKILNKMVKFKGKLFFENYSTGMYMKEVVQLLDLLKKEEGFKKLEYTLPFEDDEFDDAYEYVATLNHLMQDRVAIVSIGDPWHHWTVVSKLDLRREKMHLFDSYYNERFLTFEELTLKRKRGMIQIQTDETIIINMGNIA